MTGSTRGDADRAQSHVVGVALLLGITVVLLAGLTATVGTVVESNAAGVDAGRVAADVDDALAPVETTGSRTGPLSYGDGRLHTENRTVRLLNGDRVVETVDADALVYDRGAHRVTFLGGAVVRESGTSTTFESEPPLSTSTDALVVGVGALGDESVDTTGGGRLTLRTRVTHERAAYDVGTWRVAVETATPGVWERYFDRRGGVTSRRDFDDDGTTSVVASFPGRRAYLVVHRMRLEVDP
ncbi:DUF7289 family protein [Candidatus Halobonum tyrrellensis]|uniref:Flagellin-like protein n=1 Tax=Candidatus Halobonum tyrrellensis G22 TaxID=1324957 RepID=V4HBL7_9EURY|nr:hypothetical protein [Candidatus Halobonum tyrrellensis]ESP88105.1 hypothetical protein K933_10457 [Candidatus Halobonum tyrrellensis G22]